MRIVINKKVCINGNKIVEKPIDSFVKNFLILLRSLFLATAQNVVGVDGHTRSVGAKYKVWGNLETRSGIGGLSVNAPEGDDSYGIIVGQANTPVTPDDYKLYSKIQHGTGLGQLYYRECQVQEVGIVGNKIVLTISRQFVNYSSSNVNVGEVGLVVNTTKDNYKVLIIRDTYDPVVTIAPNDEATFEFDIYVVV